MVVKNKKEYYSLRKLKGGVASVLVGALLLTGTSVAMAEEPREEKWPSEYPIIDLGPEEPQFESRGVAIMDKDGKWIHDFFPDGEWEIDGNGFPGLPEAKDLPSFPETLGGPEYKEQEESGKAEAEEQPEKQVAPAEQPKGQEATPPSPPTLRLEEDSVTVTPPEDEDVAAVKLDGIFIFDEENRGGLLPKATKSSDGWELAGVGGFNKISLDPKTGQWTIPLGSLVKGEPLGATAVYNDGKQSERRSIDIPGVEPTPAPESAPAPTEKAPEAPAEKAPEAPAEKTPSVPAEKTPSVPAEKTPSAPAEKAPSAPAEKAPSAPAEKTPSAPAEKAPSAPAEKTPEAPAEKAPSAPAPLTRKPRGLGLGSSKQGLSEKEEQVMRLLEGAYTIFLYTDKERIEYPFHGTPEELEKKIKETITAYKSGHYPYVERFQNDKRVLLQFYKEKYLLRVISGDEGSRQHVETPFYDKEKLEDRIQELQNGAEGYDVLKQEDEDKDKKSYNKRVTLTFTRKVEKKIEPELHEEKPSFPETEVPMKPEVPKQAEVPKATPDSSTHKPRGLDLGSSKQGLSEEEKLIMGFLDSAYAIFLRTDKEQIGYPFYGSPEKLEEKIRETIEAYKSGHYPYVERFQTDKRVLLHFYKEKYLLRVISGEEGSRQQVETPFYDKKKLEDRVKELEDGAEGYDVFKQEDEDKDKKSYIKRVTLTFTRKVEKKIEPELHEEKPFFPETEVPQNPATPEKSEEPQKSESQKSPEAPSKSETQKSPEAPSKSETQKSPEVPSKSETQKSPEAPSKSETQKSSELSQNPENLQKPKVPMTSAISNATTMAQPQQVKQLPATGDLPSALTWLGGSLLGLLGAIYQKKKD
ncbi:YSIRK-type signal peptide-containing protein [Streptococcus sp. S784/96/1]|uniref:YSIRK-type signal peptide-containing protein n=1 Tax=Streptococcus sp. S784/96/1 TaxID=2653499 RepID=UPI00138A62E9|nr:YSIRK-type signal peptide-containing protein [Streptococcus sp. S784/96/1]